MSSDSRVPSHEGAIALIQSQAERSLQQTIHKDSNPGTETIGSPSLTALAIS
ncbi:MAG: hypothetical protein F6K19_20980 [Cyanothece sp. SIO1E1]|nr:hypothetical protein [Cyanothece sp. SIO1E1]